MVAMTSAGWVPAAQATPHWGIFARRSNAASMALVCQLDSDNFCGCIFGTPLEHHGHRVALSHFRATEVYQVGDHLHMLRSEAV